jgi:bifunctional non-homologous end joining protein LigD
MPLHEYRRKRDFGRTAEPRGQSSRRAAARTAALQFVVQKHAARRLHYDFRLELDGVLKSWAVPRGPSLVAGQRRMAAETEDHPLEYAGFEGVIPQGEYGGGTVLVWDRGFWTPIGDPHAGLRQGKLDFELAGEKLRGRWHLVRMRERERRRTSRPSWLLIKGNDAAAQPASAAEITETEPGSVLSGRDLDAVTRAQDRVWSSETGESSGAAAPRAPGDARDVPGSRRARLPRSAEPQLATLVTTAPSGEDWLHEVKFDGYRILCRIERGKVQLWTRAGNDWTAKLPALAAAARELPARSALLDGEVVVVDARGRSSFQALQRAINQRQADVQLYFFDLLHLDGRDLRSGPLLARKQALHHLLARLPPGSPLRYSDHVIGRGADFFEVACEAGTEGIVSKRVDAPYRAGRGRSWLKIKCGKRQEFVIAGFTEPRGSRVELGALLLAAHDAAPGSELRFCGKVGTGFDQATLADLRRRLEPLRIERPAVSHFPRARGVHWVRPELVCEVAFSEWTDDGRVRHPVFLGVREDKRAVEVQIEAPQPLPGADPASRDEGWIAGVRLSNPRRVYYPDPGITKRELAEYYERAADRVLPGLANRPLTLLRCPEGISGPRFYQKHANDSLADTIPRVRVRPGEDPYAMVTDLRSLIELVQIAVLELHVWGARSDRLDRPDLLVFDLDPDPSVSWQRVAGLASVFRVYLGELGLVPFARVTGGKGIHVVVPLERRTTWSELKEFAQGIARAFVREAPGELTARMSKRERSGKIFIDVFRNAPEATAIASYSTRAHPGAPVAMPVDWSELADAREPLRFGLRDAAARLSGPDPWAGFESSRRALTTSVRRRAGSTNDT